MNFSYRIFSQFTIMRYTLFSLPMVLLGSIMPFSNQIFYQNFRWPSWHFWIWLLLACVAARNAGMSFNRLIDKDIDALNPRTKNRELPRGIISAQETLLFALVNMLLFIFSSFQVNNFCGLLSIIISCLLYFYPYCKRFTHYRHFVLGSAYFFGPFSGWVAITNSVSVVAILLGIASFCWVSGKDIIYSIQDIEFHKKSKLYGLPSVIGKEKSLHFAACLYIAMSICLLAVGKINSLHLLYYVGLSIASMLLLGQYLIAKKRAIDESIAQKLFKIDLWTSPTLLVFSILAILMPILKSTQT